jgi:hypothetical protein
VAAPRNYVSAAEIRGEAATKFRARLRFSIRICLRIHRSLTDIRPYLAGRATHCSVWLSGAVLLLTHALVIYDGVFIALQTLGAVLDLTVLVFRAWLVLP